jgi:hypothetical protein
VNLDEVYAARAAARETISIADRVVRELAFLAAGRLRAAQCHADTLRKLKAELQDFNAVTGKWKEKP